MSNQPTSPSPEDVAAKVRELRQLQQADPTDFAEALADNIMEPDPVETAAFRAEELVFDSEAACKYLVENARSVLARRRRGSHQQLATERFLHKVNYERRLLANIINGIRAREGFLPNPPNPRKRAMMRLWNENLAGDVPQGRGRQLLEEELEVDRQRKRDQKRARRNARRTS